MKKPSALFVTVFAPIQLGGFKVKLEPVATGLTSPLSGSPRSTALV